MGVTHVLIYLCRLQLSIQATIMIKSRCVFVSLLFRIVSRLNHFQLHLIHVQLGKCYIIKIVSRLLLSIQARIMVKSRYVFVSLLFRIVSRLNHFQLHLFMFSKVNVTLLGQFLDFYCPYQLGLWLNHDALLHHYYLGLHQAWITFSYICSCSKT